MIRLFGRRVMLRPLVPTDFPSYSEVRVRCERWLVPWEPQRIVGQPDPTRDREAQSNHSLLNNTADAMCSFTP